MAVLATAFLSGKSWGTPAEQAPGRRGRSGFTAAPGSPRPPCSSRLCDVSALLVAGWGEAEAEHVCGTPKGWEAGQPPHSPLPEERPPFGGSAVQRRAGLAWAWTLWVHDAGLPAPALRLLPPRHWGVSSPKGANCRSLRGTENGVPYVATSVFLGVSSLH